MARLTEVTMPADRVDDPKDGFSMHSASSHESGESIQFSKTKIKDALVRQQQQLIQQSVQRQLTPLGNSNYVFDATVIAEDHKRGGASGSNIFRLRLNTALLD